MRMMNRIWSSLWLRVVAALFLARALVVPVLTPLGPVEAAGGTWSPAPNMASARNFSTATLLPSGRVLVAGGYAGSSVSASSQLHDPTTDTWLPAPSMASARYQHTATLLSDGRVLVAGGDGSGSPTVLASAEAYDPPRTPGRRSATW